MRCALRYLEHGALAVAWEVELQALLLLLLHLPHILHTALQVAAPQHDAAKVAIWSSR